MGSAFLSALFPSIPISHHLNATDYPRIVADHVQHIMATSSMSMTMTSVYFRNLSHSPDLNPIQHLWDAKPYWNVCGVHDMS